MNNNDIFKNEINKEINKKESVFLNTFIFICSFYLFINYIWINLSRVFFCFMSFIFFKTGIVERNLKEIIESNNNINNVYGYISIIVRKCVMFLNFIFGWLRVCFKFLYENVNNILFKMEMYIRRTNDKVDSVFIIINTKINEKKRLPLIYIN